MNRVIISENRSQSRTQARTLRIRNCLEPVVKVSRSSWNSAMYCAALMWKVGVFFLPARINSVQDKGKREVKGHFGPKNLRFRGPNETLRATLRDQQKKTSCFSHYLKQKISRKRIALQQVNCLSVYHAGSQAVAVHDVSQEA